MLSGASHILAHNNLIQNITNLPRIGKIRFLALDIGNIQNPAHSSFANGVLPRAKHQFRNALQFIPGIVGEIQHKLNSGFKAGIYLDHFLHFIFISSQNDAELSSIILHCLYQCIYGLFAVVRKTLFAIVAKSIGFVDEQHAAHGTGNNPAGFFCCCTKVLTYQTAAIHFHHLLGGQNFILVQNAGNIPCNLRFSGTGIAQEAHVDIQILTVPVCKCVCLDLFNAVFDTGQSNQFVKLLFTFSNINQRCSHRYQKTKFI